MGNDVREEIFITIVEEFGLYESHDHWDHRNHVWDDVEGEWRCKCCPMPVGHINQK